MYSETEALTVYQHLLDQTPEGPRIIEAGADKTCKCYVLPREAIAAMANEYAELKQHCIYILIGSDDDGNPMAYIGKSKDFSHREKSHEANRKFWNKALVFISRADNLYPGEIGYLEHLAQKEANEAGSYRLDNEKIEPEPGLHPTKKQEMNRFFRDIKFLTRIYGCTLFDQPKHPAKIVDKKPEPATANNWIIPFKPKEFDIKACCEKLGEVYKGEANNYKQMKAGDVGYIYVSSPVMKIMYSFEVMECHQPYSKAVEQQAAFRKGKPEPLEVRKGRDYCKLKITGSIDSELLKLKLLEQHGLNGAPMTAQRISQPQYKEVEDYIGDVFAGKIEQPAKEGLIACRITRNCDARGLFDPETERLTLLKGSRINAGHTDGFSKARQKSRQELLKEFAKKEGKDLVLKQDVEFDSPSGAAVFCVGGSENGWKAFKDENGKKLIAYRKVQAEKG